MKYCQARGRGYYSKAHYARVSPPPDTAEAIAERLAYIKIRDQVRAEFAVRYPVLTAENAQEAIEWQANRINELQKV